MLWPPTEAAVAAELVSPMADQEITGLETLDEIRAKGAMKDYLMDKGVPEHKIDRALEAPKAIPELTKEEIREKSSNTRFNEAASAAYEADNRVRLERKSQQLKDKLMRKGVTEEERQSQRSRKKHQTRGTASKIGKEPRRGRQTIEVTLLCSFAVAHRSP